MKVFGKDIGALWLLITLFLALSNLVTGSVLAGYCLYFILGFRVGEGWKAYMVKVVEQGEKWKKEWGLDRSKGE